LCGNNLCWPTGTSCRPGRCLLPIGWVGSTGNSKPSPPRIEFEALSSRYSTVQQTTIQHTQSQIPLCHAFHSPFLTHPPIAFPAQPPNSHLLQHLPVANSHAASSSGCTWPGVFAAISPVSPSPPGPSDAAPGVEHFMNPRVDVVHQSRPTLACATQAQFTRHLKFLSARRTRTPPTSLSNPSSIIRAWSEPSTALPRPRVFFFCSHLPPPAPFG